MDVDILAGSGRRRRSHDGRSACGRPRRTRRGQRLRRSSRPGERPTTARSTTLPVPSRSDVSAASGCTSMVRTGSPRFVRPVCVIVSMASRTSTRSSSTRTSGSSHRSTRAHSSTETRRSPRRLTRRRRATSKPSTSTPSGTPATTRSTCHVAPAACRSGSRLATHGTNAYTEPQSSRPCRLRKPPPTEFVHATTSSWSASPICRSWSSVDLAGRSAQYYQWSDRLLAANFAFVLPTTHERETVTRFAIVNPRTSVADVELILDTMAG